MPIKIKKSLEKGKIPENDWKDVNKLSKLLNYCINIEMDIKSINDLKDSVSNVKNLMIMKLSLLLKMNLLIN